MTTAAWHARIECGNEVDAGFLVSARRGLTCAHVVRQSGAADVTVSFPQRKELGALSATVWGSGRGRAADRGVVARVRQDDKRTGRCRGRPWRVRFG